MLWHIYREYKESEKTHAARRRKAVNKEEGGHLGGSVVENLPLAQDVIPGPGIESCIRLPTGSLLPPLPVSLPPCVCLS